MLTPEQAQAELKKLENKQWVEVRIASAARLPDKMRSTARTFLGQEQAPMLLDQMAQAQAGQRILETFAGMDDAARLQFFQALFPCLAPAVERGWQLLDRLPYQAGWYRKPFRAPNHPEAVLARRINWVLQLLAVVGPYQQDLRWFAAWAAHLVNYSAADELGILLAAAMDAGSREGDEIFEILCASAKGEHEIGAMGRHVTRALLCASRPDGWQFVEGLLLAAQREEGLRQVILESVDEAHPSAFRRMLRLILDNNLARFSATVRAFDVWLGYQWDAVSAGVVNATIEKILTYFEDSTARDMALKGKDAEQAYLALWTLAFDDAVAAVVPAAELLKHPKAEHRFVAVHLLDQTQLIMAHAQLLSASDDADLRVAIRVLLAFQHQADDRIRNADLFERLERLMSRYPDKPTKLKPAVWPWTAHTISKETVANALTNNLGQRPPTRLIPHLGHMGVYSRAAVVRILAEQQQWDSATRDTLFALVGDPSRQVREAALLVLAKCKITAAEAASMEKLLDRKSSDLRRGVLTLLSLQPDAEALASADRLLAAKSQPQRLAGLELLRDLVENKRCLDLARARAEQYRAAHGQLNQAEGQQIEAVLAVGGQVPTLEDVLGLIRHDDRTWPLAPVSRNVQFHSKAAAGIVSALEGLLKANAQQMANFKNAAGEECKSLLSDLTYGFPHPDPKKPLAEDREHLPLADLWENWWQTRGPELRDADGMELIRGLAWFEFAIEPYHGPSEMVKAFPDAAKIMFGEIPSPDEQPDRWRVRDLLRWLVRLHPPVGGVDFILDAAESALALVPTSFLQLTEDEAAVLSQADVPLHDLVHYDPQGLLKKLAGIQAKANWRGHESPFGVWLQVARTLFTYAPQLWTPAHHTRHWQILRWIDEPVRSRECGGDESAPSKVRSLSRERPGILDLCLAREAGGATDADIFDQLLGERDVRGYGRYEFSDLGAFTMRKVPIELSRFTFVHPLAERCRRRILEVELTRGDNSTAASSPALSLRSVWGIDNLVAILRSFGQTQFVRGWARDNQSKDTVFSHLVRCSFPIDSETPADFKDKALPANISENRLVELAVYAPQWAAHVEHVLCWQGLTEAVWWIHAHTKGTDWTVDQEIRELWQADLSSRTALSSADLLEGAVDVAWFLRVHDALGDKRWSQLYEAAKFASTGAGHSRARLFADAMLGEVPKKELVQRVKQKRHQDGVRALGLLPLSAKAREADLLDRYKVIQEFRRGSKQFGSQRQASEKRAAQIGQQNLARTADFADPIRLEWAMEAKAVEDLADGPIEVTVEDVKVSLGIDPWGEVDLKVSREGKALSDIPSKLKKHPKVSALRERKVELKRQASRIRPSLEQFMVRGDEFTGTELRDLMEHPLLAPLLTNLVLIGDGIVGYPVHEGKAIEDYRGQVEAVKASEKLRIAHPHDLLPAVQWHGWQKDCFARERIQPFKQVFRELYPLTEAEKKEGIQTRRYAGHQVQPRQALALLGQRGWVHHPEEGVRKTFHEAGIVAWLHFQEGFNTPAEIEGLTLEGVFFTKRGEHEPLKLIGLPPRLFSETMRDLDLVVSVAHRGGVDPEASASTVEMRASLIDETCRLLKLGNVHVKDRYALIDGKLGQYSVHLGSAVTRKMPGESLFIVVVHGQHRGRLFLPFADNDPKTAEVLSKVLLLARDQEIKDPNILDQIR